jgi:hypothetical protein
MRVRSALAERCPVAGISLDAIQMVPNWQGAQ